MVPRRKNIESLHILIVSAAGMQNTGDNIVSLVAAGIFIELNEKYDVKFANLGFDMAEVEWADIIVLGGGGVLYAGPDENVENYMRFIDHAYYMKKPSIVLGVGTQGIVTEYGKRRYRESLSRTSLITVRDMSDAQVLAVDVGVEQAIHTTQDLAFLLPDILPHLQDKFSTPSIYDVSIDRGLRVGISISSEESSHVDERKKISIANKRAYDNKKIKLVEDIASAGHVPVLLKQSRDDAELYSRILNSVPTATLIELGGKYDALSVLDLYRTLDCVITSRYHGFIMALLAEKPIVILDGVNSGKIIKTINSTIPSLKGRVFNTDTIENIDISSLDDTYSVPQAQKDETNEAIIKARNTIMYVQSFMYGYNSGRRP